MSIPIRRALESDLEKIFPLVQDFVTSFEADFEEFSKAFSSILKDDKSLVLVVEQDNNVVGYCLGFWHETFYANGRVSWLEEIMVHKSFRRSGLAKQLMASFEVWSVENGAKLTALATRRASSFYEAIGYEGSATYFRKLL